VNERRGERDFQNHLHQTKSNGAFSHRWFTEKQIDPQKEQQLEVSWIAIDNARKRDILLNLFNFDGWLVAGLSAGNDHDVATFDFCDTIALIADCLDGHITYFAFLHGRS